MYITHTLLYVRTFICAYVCILAWEVISLDIRDCNSYSYPNKPYKFNTDFFVIKKYIFLFSKSLLIFITDQVTLLLALCLSGEDHTGDPVLTSLTLPH